MHDLLHDIHHAQYKAAREAQLQSARLTRLMDQSRMDAGKTHDMLAVIMEMLQVQQQGGVMSPEEKVREGGGVIGVGWGANSQVVFGS